MMIAPLEKTTPLPTPPFSRKMSAPNRSNDPVAPGLVVPVLLSNLTSDVPLVASIRPQHC